MLRRFQQSGPSHAAVQLRPYWGSPAILLSKRPELEAQEIGLLQGLRKVAIDELAKVEGDLQREAKEDAELKERHGSAWRRPSSAALNAKFMEKVAGEETHLCCSCCVIDAYC